MFPAWEKLFKNLCKTQIEEEGEKQPEPTISVEKVVAPKKPMTAATREQNDVRIRSCQRKAPVPAQTSRISLKPNTR